MQPRPSIERADNAPAKKTIYINPNFTASQLPPTTRPHINPLFQGRLHVNPNFRHHKENLLLAQQQWQQLVMQRHWEAAAAAAAAQANRIAPQYSAPLIIAPPTLVPPNILQVPMQTATEAPAPSPVQSALIQVPVTTEVAAIHINPTRKLVRKTTGSSAPAMAPTKIAGDLAKTPTNMVFAAATAIRQGVQTTLALTRPTPRYKLDRRPRPTTTPLIVPSARPIGGVAKKPPPLNVNSFQKNERRLRVVNINGVLYKSTYNKLQRRTAKTPPTSTSKPTILSSMSSAQSTLRRPPALPTIGRRPGNALFLNGTKYLMDPTGFRLTRMPSSTTPANKTRTTPATAAFNTFPTPHTAAWRRRRIDIGGLTFVASQSANDVFVRTQHHLTRAHLNSAKQRSLLLLSRSRVKNNLPCVLFQRLGKCAAYERGKCNKVHDKRHILICPKFLRDECRRPDCLLSHTVSLAKMPVCRFFLQGACVRADCPYLHKKLSGSAELCRDFLQGYCALAERCNKRHEFVCLVSEKRGKCELKSCRFCRAKKAKVATKKTTTTTAAVIAAPQQKPKDSPAEEDNLNSVCRYFIGPAAKMEDSTDDLAESNADLNTDNTNNDSNSEREEEHAAAEDEASDAKALPPHRRRPKLGPLPAFIPLT